ncbi:MAG: GNAT family N-acetyltransferase [Endozoicomonas sp.]|uniref:GNAT family N-acetyltransferase n=1 Tax=Endozoicomonas sp. TaxID=1892382 RepID=UPI003D9B6622
MFRIETKRLSARLARNNDSQSLFERYTGRLKESRFLARLPHESATNTTEKLETWSTQDAWTKDNRLILVIEERKSQSAIGQLTLIRRRQSLEFHFGISHDFSGKGLVPELLEGLVRSDLASGCSLNTYCDCKHLDAQKVLEKAGFSKTGFEARKYQNPNKDNQWVDCFIYQRKG